MSYVGRNCFYAPFPALFGDMANHGCGYAVAREVRVNGKFEFRLIRILVQPVVGKRNDSLGVHFPVKPRTHISL